ncbi:MAG: N-acetylmuramoyl-L-alanine amidase [Lachnospiraceae bacterium]|nr:N-acetylmuramoyl-L-alanine amidase [Lachnospiraceae bacterium]
MKRKRTQKIKGRTAAQKKRRMKRALRLGFVLLILLALLLGVMKVSGRCSNEYSERTGDAIDALRPEMDVELLTVNPYSRPGTSTQKITGIVVHYTANPGATAMENRNYFENLKDTHETKASSNFVVGIEGEIVQCVPTWEVAYASNSRNIDTVSIECCHPDETGKFTDATYRSVVNLCAWLCMKFDLGADDVIRHYDVTGKECPKYFVDHEDAWENFRQDVKETLVSQQNY